MMQQLGSSSSATKGTKGRAAATSRSFDAAAAATGINALLHCWLLAQKSGRVARLLFSKWSQLIPRIAARAVNQFAKNAF
mmetsp:Transcript_80871/g.156145  ORF Transcript_80871/g.156145 Transcript_80871/m.156145 type:complete len:80 (+) Transcript_80871:177-416(+)